VISYSQPTKINFGLDVCRQIPFSGKKVLCIVSKSADLHSNISSLVCEDIRNTGANPILHVRTGGEPTSDEVDQLTASTPLGLSDIIAIGGGSVLDVAKFVAMLKFSGGKCTDYEYGDPQIAGSLPTYMVPTTSGSGSEVTPYSVIQNSTTNRKFTIYNSVLFPTAAYIDPTLTTGLPLLTSLASGLDAFIHCLEAYLNTAGHPLVRPLAIEGMRLAYVYLPQVAEDLFNLKVRTQLSLASIMGGLCITNSRTGLIHTLSVALSEFSHNPHGIVNARMLPYALRYNAPFYSGTMKQIIHSVMGISIKNDAEAVEVMVEWVNSMLSSLDLNFIDGHIVRDKITHLVERVQQDSGLPEINHGPLSSNILKSLFEEVASDAN
jgi:alcohol dehydrogenase class IV